jgi:aminopeptidase N
MEQFVVDQQQAVFANDALLSAQPLTSESNTPAEISAKFGTITYSKGTDFLHNLPTVKICYAVYHIHLQLIMSFISSA